MFDLKSPAKAGFTRLRGRPKHGRRVDKGTIQLQQKRDRVRKIIKDLNGEVHALSWLHIAQYDGTIDQDLFDLGTRYLRLRTCVMRHQERRLIKLGCHSLTKNLQKGSSIMSEKDDEKAEELWTKLLSLIASETISTLDELLLGIIDYSLNPDILSYNKLRLKNALEALRPYADYF